MSQETCAGASPFAALSYQEQQNRWLEWRSRQLDYRPAGDHPPRDGAERTSAAKQEMARDRQDAPLLRIPNLALNAPTGRRELNEVLSRHARAARRAGAFQTASMD